MCDGADVLDAIGVVCIERVITLVFVPLPWLGDGTAHTRGDWFAVGCVAGLALMDGDEENP